MRRRARIGLGVGLALAALVVLAARGFSGMSDRTSASPASIRLAGAPPADLQQRFVAIVGTVSPEVVQIQSPVGLGSGVVFDDHADIVTNAHVVEGARQFVVTLASGARHPATLLGAERTHDLAMIHVSGARPPAASFGSSSKLEVGDLVLAIGNPLGLRSSVTQGIVSSLHRTVFEDNSIELSPIIQTSAAINPGNSGGALVDLSGRVIGIPTLAALDPEMDDAQAPGIGFAIPSDTVQKVAARLVNAAIRQSRRHSGPARRVRFRSLPQRPRQRRSQRPPSAIPEWRA